MTATAKRFSAGFAATAFAGAFFNFLPYLLTRGAYNGDGFEVVGFPFTFRRLVGLAGIYEFRVPALVADIALALLVALVVGYAFGRFRRREGP